MVETVLLVMKCVLIPVVIGMLVGWHRCGKSIEKRHEELMRIYEEKDKDK